MSRVRETLRFEDLGEGQSVTKTFAFSSADIQAFSDIVQDTAPVHVDPEFAASKGFRGPVVHGFHVAAKFSGLLGMELPGPHSIVHSIHVEFVKPTYYGETLTYSVMVTRLHPATKTVVLSLKAYSQEGEIVLRGTAQCGFVEKR